MLSTRCSKCGDLGWRPARPDEPEFIPGYVMNVPCEDCLPQRNARQREELQKVSGMTEPERHQRLNLIRVKDRPGTLEMVQACRDLLAGRASLITLWGSHGNAKSAVLAATVNEFLEKGVPAIYLPAYDLLNWIQDAIGRDQEVRSESTLERLERIKGVRMLAVDELQAVRVTDWRLEQIRNLIDRRWRDGLDGKSFTLLAMNENPETLEPRIYSRLLDGRNRAEGCPVLHNTDPDMRPLMRRKQTENGGS